MSHNNQSALSTRPSLSATSKSPQSPSTPTEKTGLSAATTPASTPGTWKHPRMDEIAARQSASTFTDRNVNIIAWNAAILLISFVVKHMTRQLYVLLLILLTPILTRHRIPSLFENLTSLLSPYGSYVVMACRLILLYNIAYAFSPLVRQKDDLSDIPLTPTQRKLLGLPPSSTPDTPGSNYVTPPRFPRSTPRSSERATVGSSLSARSSPRGGSPSGSPYSPVPSPLLHKAVSSNASRRLSFGTPSPLSSSRVASDSSLDQSKLPSTPTPTSGSRASVQINNRWIFERGRASPGRNNMYT